MTPHEISLVAASFTAHLTTHHDALLTAVAKLVETQAVEMEPKDVVPVTSTSVLISTSGRSYSLSKHSELIGNCIELL